MKELKPCPFCGGKAKILSRAIDWLLDEHIIKCESCNCRTDTYETKGEAREAWNKRYKEGE